jgi:hypothetical protein
MDGGIPEPRARFLIHDLRYAPTRIENALAGLKNKESKCINNSTAPEHPLNSRQRAAAYLAFLLPRPLHGRSCGHPTHTTTLVVVGRFHPSTARMHFV